MTLRAVLLGLMGSAILNGLCYFNDFVLRQSYLVGSYLPLTVYGGLLIVVLAVNPLIAKAAGKRFGLKGSELAVIMALLLTACYVPGRGLMHYFTTVQIFPHYYEKTTPGWQAEKITKQAPERMLINIEGENEKAFDKFFQGHQDNDKPMTLSDIPWGAWKRSLWFWTPLIICFSIGLIGLALALHKQWSKNEHLAYPIATFAGEIMSDEEGKLAAVFRKRSFWIGAGIVLAIHMSNYLAAWFPDYMVGIPVRHNFTSLARLFPNLRDGGGFWLFYPTIYFCVIGFAYFLSSDVSLSLGIAPFVYCTAVGYMLKMGIEARGGGFLYPSNESFFYAGSYFAIFTMILYAGRHYYLTILKKAVLIDRLVTEEDSTAVWGFRTFMVAFMLFVLQLAVVGLDWQLAVLYTFLATMIFVVISRIVAETGAFFIHAWFFPCAMIWGLMGERALGVQPLLIMMMVSSMLLIDPREAVMPFVIHALKITDDKKVKIGRVAALSGFSLVIAFAVAIPATLYWQYNKGGTAMGDGWTNSSVPRFSFNNAVKVSHKLKAQGTYEEAQALSGFKRFFKINPKGSCLVSFAVFFALTLGCSIARLRLPWWPIHPVLFAVLGTFQSKMLAVSFLLGWFLKTMVNKFGGAKTYRDLKPLMIGLIAGEIFGGVILLIVGGIYYLVNGEAPSISFQIFRG